MRVFEFGVLGEPWFLAARVMHQRWGPAVQPGIGRIPQPAPPEPACLNAARARERPALAFACFGTRRESTDLEAAVHLARVRVAHVAVGALAQLDRDGLGSLEAHAGDDLVDAWAGEVEVV